MIAPDNDRTNKACQRVMAFEMQTGGHHPSYIRNFATQWAEKIHDASIDFVVRKQFIDEHQPVYQLVSSIAPERIRIHAMTDQESYQVRVSNKFREFSGWKLFCHYASKLNVDKGMLMYSDHFQLPMILGEKAPCQVSCIYFRPTFHYEDFQNYNPTWFQRLQSVQKRMLVSRMLKLQEMESLYCLDRFAAKYIASHIRTQARILSIPDSFVQPEVTQRRVDKLRSELAIGEGRKVLLLLGILDKRKGPLQLLKAIKDLKAETKKEACLILGGKIQDAIESEVLDLARQLQQENLLQVIVRNEYITDTLVQEYYEVADIALTTYQGHMGMSSALIRAALAGIPVLSQSYGLMGELVVQEELGTVVDTRNQTDFTAGLEKAILQCNSELFDPEKAMQFANSHTPEALGETLQDWVRH